MTQHVNANSRVKMKAFTIPRLSPRHVFFMPVVQTEPLVKLFFFYAHQTWCNERLTSVFARPRRQWRGRGGSQSTVVFLNQPLLCLTTAKPALRLRQRSKHPPKSRRWCHLSERVRPRHNANTVSADLWKRLRPPPRRCYDKSLAGASIRTRWFCVYVIWEWDGLEFKCATTRPHSNPATSSHPAAPVGSSAPCRCWKCSFCCRLLFPRFFFLLLPPPLCLPVFASVWV